MTSHWVAYGGVFKVHSNSVAYSYILKLNIWEAIALPQAGHPEKWVDFHEECQLSAG
jgi:hypothetical protein